MFVSVQAMMATKEIYYWKNYTWKECDTNTMKTETKKFHDADIKRRNYRKGVAAPKIVEKTKNDSSTSIYGTVVHLKDFVVSVFSIISFTLRSIFTTGTMISPFLRFVIAICTFIPRSLNVVCSILNSMSSFFTGNSKDDCFLKNMMNLIYNINASPVHELARLSRDFLSISTAFIQSLVQFYPRLVDFLAFLLQFMRMYCDCLSNLYHFVSNVYSLNYKFWVGCRNTVYRMKYVTIKVLKMFTW